MPRIHIIAVGRLREPHWKEAAEAYRQRLKHSFDLTETIVRDGDASLDAGERTRIEGERILQSVKSACMLVCLDERGEATTSARFARFLQQAFDAARPPCFVIGGAYGLSEAVKERADKLLGLGPMTFPHELARVVLLEQLYRADSILRGRPYHHG
ncbi:MAG: 23S rRNA (pseudouridine(1915)-N(3))-methyltransferase RlmH [Deltaproteobacteria bacterium]|nr:23S rRNA (pseudouridine(1915)-N(3))-methyltransferase RlmH [Deltaproteobacteria bacterium]